MMPAMWRARTALLPIGCLTAIPLFAAGAQLEVPFVLLHNQILLEARIDGRGPYNFVLDSGTFRSTVDVRLARALRLPLGAAGTKVAGAGNGRVSALQTTLGRVSVGDLSLTDLPASAIDLSAVSGQLGRPLHGVLGYSFLGSRIVQIDYFRRRIRFYAESPFAPEVQPSDTARRVSFPMQFRQDSILPVLEDCYVNGRKISITIDTGSSLGLILFPQAIRYLDLEQLARTGIPMAASGYGGTARLTKGWAKSLVLKTIDLGAVEVAYVKSGYAEDEKLERRGGNLGNAVLQDFVLTLDYRNSVVVMEAALD
jgi:predicted aspartyl protease